MFGIDTKGFLGFIDRLSADALHGWVWRPQHPGRRVMVQWLLDGRPGVESRADIFRADLLSAGMGDGKHGFALPVPADDLFLLQPRTLSIAVDGVPVAGFSVPVGHLRPTGEGDIAQLLFGFLLPSLDEPGCALIGRE